MAFWKEFKTFAMKGNVMDMAVGVIIGGAFGKIVTSLVNDVLMPPIGALLGNVNFTDLKIDISKVRDLASSATDAVSRGVNALTGEVATVTEKVVEPIYWNYGAFIQQCFDFFILALCVFMMVKVMNKMSAKRKAEEAAVPAPPPAPSKEEVLLTEIRDLLKEQNEKK